jgi:amino acid transporter
MQMKRWFELLFYVTFGAGMAFGMSSFTMLSGLNEIVTGPWVVVAIVLAGLLCSVIASSVAELASMFPSAPGVRTYLKAAFDNRVSLMLVYLYLIFMVLVAAVEAYMFALVLGAVFPAVPAVAAVLGIIGFTVVVNVLGLELPKTMQIVTTLLLIVLIMGLGAVGITRGTQPPGAHEGWEQAAKVPAAIGMAVYLFIGFEWITMLGMRPDSYRRTIPLSMPLAIATNVVAYSCVAFGFWRLLPHAAIIAGTTPQVPFFTALLGSGGPYLALGISFLAIFSTFNAGVMGGSRLMYALSREGILPGWCARMNERGAPVGGVLTLGTLSALAALVVVTWHLEILAAVIGSAFVCFVYAAFMLAVIKLRRTRPQARRSFRTRVPEWLQWAIAGAFPLLGLSSLVSQPGPKSIPIVGALAFVAAAALLTRWSHARTEKSKRATPYRPVLEPEA